MQIVIDEDGTLRFIHADSLLCLMEQGEATITRASHVEPTGRLAGKPAWEADLSPVSGPTLGPYRTRQEALDAEVQWLLDNIL